MNVHGDFSGAAVDARLPPEDAAAPAHCRAGRRHRRVAGALAGRRETRQWPLLSGYMNLLNS